MRRFCETSDAAAFDLLARRYHKPAVAVARGHLGTCGHMAEDAVQETFIRLFRHGARFDLNRPFAAWFYSILRHVCIDFLRQRTRQGALLERFAQDPSFRSEEPPATPAEDDILLRINPADREILIYRLVHGLSFDEIATQLDCSVESAKKRAQRALQRLRQAATENAASNTAVSAG
jgi:RNA polymerase sigma-70 factor (ECF subfamily)